MEHNAAAQAPNGIGMAIRAEGSQRAVTQLDHAKIHVRQHLQIHSGKAFKLQIIVDKRLARHRRTRAGSKQTVVAAAKPGRYLRIGLDDLHRRMKRSPDASKRRINPGPAAAGDRVGALLTVGNRGAKVRAQPNRTNRLEIVVDAAPSTYRIDAVVNTAVSGQRARAVGRWIGIQRCIRRTLKTAKAIHGNCSINPELRVGDDGCVLPPGVPKSRADNDLFPGVVLFNLAQYGLAIGDDLGIDWKTVCDWYLRRAALVHPWRLMAWHAQVWGLVGELTGDLGYHQVAVDLAAWMADRQLRVDGSFFTGMGTGGPGFDAAFSAEGVAAGWRSAALLGDDDGAARLADCWRGAMAFADRLVFRAEDTYWSARPERVLGGVRASLTGSSLQVDYTGHTLQALVGAFRLTSA